MLGAAVPECKLSIYIKIKNIYINYWFVSPIYAKHVTVTMQLLFYFIF